jgi:predicted phosphodiesterase
MTLDTLFAVIADIHGNADALAAVLDDIDRLGIRTILNLGDHLSGPLAAAETADMLMRREMTSIRGNHDRWLLEQEPAQMGPSDRAAFEELSERHLDWLRGLPATSRPAVDVFLCHGTPDSDTTYWLETVAPDGTVHGRPLREIEGMASVSASLLLCGHTHLPRAVRLGDGRLVVNPGSVGLPGFDDDAPVPHVLQAGNTHASYAVVAREPRGWDVTFRLVPYDTQRMVAMARSAGRPEWARVLETGWMAP